jgi:hypothetical protein
MSLKTNTKGDHLKLDTGDTCVIFRGQKHFHEKRLLVFVFFD